MIVNFLFFPIVCCVFPYVLVVEAVFLYHVQRIMPQNISSLKWKDVSMSTLAWSFLTSLKEYDQPIVEKEAR
jgi:hypothetical protein